MSEAYALSSDFLGEDHVVTAKEAHNLSTLTLHEGSHQEALDQILAVQAMQGYLQVGLTVRIQSKCNQIDALTMLRRTSEAIAIGEPLVKQARQDLKAGDSLVARCEGSLGMALIRGDRVEEGLALLRKVVIDTSARFGPLGIATLNREQDLLSGLLDAHHLEETVQLARREIRVMQGVFDLDHIFYWNARQCLTEALIEQTDFDGAQVALDEIQSTMDLSGSQGNSDRVKTMQMKLNRLRAAGQ